MMCRDLQMVFVASYFGQGINSRRDFIFGRDKDVCLDFFFESFINDCHDFILGHESKGCRDFIFE